MNDNRGVRNLAQAGALAGAVFAALVGADPFDIRNRARPVKLLDYAAIALWVAAVVLFLFAMASPEPDQPGQPQTPRSLGNRLSAQMLRPAMVVTGLAGVCTILALVLTPFGRFADSDSVLLQLRKREANALDDLCAKPGHTLAFRGSIPTQTLADPFITFTFAAEANSACDTVRIPAADVLALEEHPPP